LSVSFPSLASQAAEIQMRKILNTWNAAIHCARVELGALMVCPRCTLV
jgi:hypothetical protein